MSDISIQIAFARDEAKSEAEIQVCGMWQSMFPVQKPYIELTQGEDNDYRNISKLSTIFRAPKG